MTDPEFRDDVRSAIRIDERPRRRRRTILLVVAGLVAAAGLTGAGLYAEHTCFFASGAIERDTFAGECIGVSDGSYTFDDHNLGSIMKLIAAENATLTKGEYVSIALAMPMTSGPNDTRTPNSIRRALLGAYLGQWDVNHTASEGHTPKIRLLIANSGTSGTHWKATADLLAGMTGVPDRLVGVTGIGSSTNATQQLLRELSKDIIAMSGATITSTALTWQHFPGLVRVAPSNSDEAKAAVQFLATADLGTPDVPGVPRTAMLVQDRNKSDDYVTTLGAAFSREFPTSDGAREIVGQTESYDGSIPLGNRFSDIAAAVCTTRPAPDILYFAGRGRDLGPLVAALRYRPCDHPLTVMSGDDAWQMTMDNDSKLALQQTGARKLQVLYTGLASPAAWGDSTIPDAKGYRLFEDVVSRSLGDSGIRQDELNDGTAMMNHDAVLALVKAIRPPSIKNADVYLPGHDEVLQNLKGLHGRNTVFGASGVIAFDDESGQPYNKPVVVMRHESDGSLTFVTMSWPTGQPNNP